RRGHSDPSAAIPAAPVAPPPIPTGLAAVAGNTRVSLGWTPKPGATSYVVRRGPAPGRPDQAIPSAPTNGHADTLLSNDTTYYYTVAAKNAGGESAPSDEIAATPVGPPPAPLDVWAAPGTTCVSLRWRPAANAERYRVMRSATPGGPYAAIGNPEEPSFVDTD